MGIFKLIINECIKIFKKKSTIVFLGLSIISLILSYGIIRFDMNQQSKYIYTDDSIDFMEFEQNKLENEFKTANKEKQEKLNCKIETYEYAIENDIHIRALNKGYQEYLTLEILKQADVLDSIDENTMKDEYDKCINEITKLNKILKSGNFEDYIAYKKEKINEGFYNKLLTDEEYKVKIEEQDLILKYEIDKYPNSSDIFLWKKALLNENYSIDRKIKEGYDSNKKEYLTNDSILQLQEQKMINLYRLDNNIPPNNVINPESSIDSHYRWNYDNLAISISMFFITLLFIVLAASSISEETSKGTIKFLLITPYERFEILVAKLISYVLILIIITLLLSQINALLGNLFFPNTVNDYIYVSNNKIEIINTNLYITLQYILKLPEILIYILLGITLSALTRSTTMANTFTVITYIGSSIAINIIRQFIKIDFLKYLPFNNFDLKYKIFVFDTSTTNFAINNYQSDTTLGFSLIVLCITAFLLLVTMFESFNKRDVN